MADTFVYRYGGQRIDSDHELSPDEVRKAFKSGGIDLPAAPIPKSDTLGSQLVKGATATLPIMGGVLGGMAGSAGLPVVGTAVGAGGGAALGEGLRQLINQYLAGGHPLDVGDMLMTGLGTGATAGAMEAWPGIKAALSPTGILNDVERTGTVSPGPIGAGMVRRGVSALRKGLPPGMVQPAFQQPEGGYPGSVTKRPLWMAQEGQAGPAVTDQERDIAGTLGRTSTAPPTTTAQPKTPDAWDRMLDEARRTRPPVKAPPVLRKGAPTVQDSIRQAIEDAKGSGATDAGTTPPARTQTPLGKPSVTPAEADELAANASGKPTSSAGDAELAKQIAADKAKVAANDAKVAPTTDTRKGGVSVKGGAAKPKGPSSSAKANLANDAGDDPVMEEIYNRINPDPNAPPKGNGAPDAATLAQEDLLKARTARGAGRVGQDIGVGKKGVRVATGPIVAETPGEASDVLPMDVFHKILDKMKGMTPGSPERDAYVAAAKDRKTRAQLENMKRMLARLGLMGAGTTAATGPKAVSDQLQTLLKQYGVPQQDQQ